MNLVRIKEEFLESVKSDRLSDAAYDYIYRGLNRITMVLVLKCVMIDTVDHKFLRADKDYTYEFLDPEKLAHLSKRQEHRLEKDFLDEALGKRDECFGIMDSDTLASYGWYSNNATRLRIGLRLHFNERYIYMYNGFTHPNYRGQRLHAIGMTMALAHYLSKGYKGIVSWVEANNFSSLRSCYRMGYRDFGEIYIIKLFSRQLVLCSRGCKDYGFKVSAIR